jgi:hypothetical protein
VWKGCLAFHQGIGAITERAVWWISFLAVWCGPYSKQTFLTVVNGDLVGETGGHRECQKKQTKKAKRNAIEQKVIERDKKQPKTKR